MHFSSVMKPVQPKKPKRKKKSRRAEAAPGKRAAPAKKPAQRNGGEAEREHEEAIQELLGPPDERG